MQPKTLGLSLFGAAMALAAPQAPPMYTTVNVTVPTSAYSTSSSDLAGFDSSATISATSLTTSPAVSSAATSSIIWITPPSISTSAAYIHIEESKTGFDDLPGPTKTQKPSSEATPTEEIQEPTKPGQADLPTPSPNNTPDKNPHNSHTSSTPVYTLIKTVVNSQTTQVPVFIVPGVSEPATLGQTVTVNGQATVLAPPPALFTTVSTTVDGVATEVPVYVIGGSTTASLGQTVTLDGTVSVLSTPTGPDAGPKTIGPADLVARGAKLGRMGWSAMAVGAVGVVFGWL